VRDAIAHYPAITAGGTDASVNAHRAARLSSLNLQRIRATPEGGSHRDWPRELLVPCHRDRERSFTDAYGRLAWDALAPGLTTRCISYSNGRFGHPDQDRAISVREAAALQTFPRGFAFAGPIALLARQIGNAVPVALAAAFAGSLRNHLATEVALAT
jgi:DNA (cytosine-5)-methyltransferase 1